VQQRLRIQLREGHLEHLQVALEAQDERQVAVVEQCRHRVAQAVGIFLPAKVGGAHRHRRRI